MAALVRPKHVLWLALAASPFASCTVSDLDRLSASYGVVDSTAGAGGVAGMSGSAGASNVLGGAGGQHGGAAGKGGVGGASGASGEGGHAGQSGNAGHSGQSGASGSAGSSACTSSAMSCNGCFNCVSTQGGECAAAAAACSMNSECNALNDCYAACDPTNSMCFTTCDEMHTAGVADYNAETTCEDAACAGPCTTILVCDPVKSVSMGSCYDGMGCNPVTNSTCNPAAGEACDYDGTSKFICYGPPPPNTVGLCGDCTVNLCAPGLNCIYTSMLNENTAACAIVCCTDEDCGPKGKCAVGNFPVGGFCQAK